MLSLKLLFMKYVFFEVYSCFVCVLHICFCPQYLQQSAGLDLFYFKLGGGGTTQLKAKWLGQAVRCYLVYPYKCRLIFNTPRVQKWLTQPHQLNIGYLHFCRTLRGPGCCVPGILYHPIDLFYRLMRFFFLHNEYFVRPRTFVI